MLLLRLLQDDPDAHLRGRDRDPARAFAVGLILDLLESELVGVEIQGGLLVVDEDPDERYVLYHRLDSFAVRTTRPALVYLLSPDTVKAGSPNRNRFEFLRMVLECR